MRKCSLDEVKGSVHTDVDHPIPKFRFSLCKLGKNYQPRVVDEHVKTTKSINCERNDTVTRFGVLQILTTRGGKATVRSYLRRNTVRHRWIKPASVLGNTGIMHNHSRAASRKKASVSSTKAATAASDNRDLTVEADH